MNVQNPNVAQRAALYLRVSTTRQAEHDVSIPDQRKQGETYCASRGYQLVETFVEAGASATNDRRPEFQRMIEAGTLSSVVQFSAKVGFENSLVGGPFISFCRG